MKGKQFFTNNGVAIVLIGWLLGTLIEVLGKFYIAQVIFSIVFDLILVGQKTITLLVKLRPFNIMPMKSTMFVLFVDLSTLFFLFSCKVRIN
jgi:hypothetical protein